MLALERRNLILEKLQAEKRVVVSELSQLYEVSEETIRRDLDKLEKEGLATKSYGGAVINEDVIEEDCEQSVWAGVLLVITNSMEILLELSDVSGWNIISTGGVMKEGYLAFLGSKTEDAIRSYYVDKVIISCKALDHEWGIMESQEAFGTTKKAMIASGREKILVVDSTKFDQTAFSVAGKLRDIDVVVTDRKPSEKWLAHFAEEGVECRYPGMRS